MSYTVFALKWRPKSFDEIIGQDHIVKQLKSAIEKDRLAHAYLFSGPRGVGKTSTARILARALNCKNGPTARPCGECPACKDISAGRSLDVIEIDGASNRGIDEIRTLRENVKFSPAGGKFKVYIIDEVHQITTDGFNALLKTLEEPPEFVKFIFATTQANKIPLTILSRCQRLDFRRIPLMEIISQLEKIIAGEGIKVDKEVLFAVARAADGALRDAESILDQLVAFSRDNIKLEDAVSMLGMVEVNTLFEVVDRIIARDPAASLELLNGMIENGKDANIFLANLIEHYRNLMVAKVAGDNAGLIDLPEDVRKKLKEQAQAMSLEEIFNGFNVLVNTQETAKRMESLRIPLEVSLVRLCLGKTVNPAQAENPVQKTAARSAATQQAKAKPAAIVPKPSAADVSKPAASAGAPPEEKEKPQSENMISCSLERVAGLWHDIVQNTSKAKISIGHYLKEGAPVKLLGNTLTVAFHKNRSLYKESLEKNENRIMVENIIQDALGARLKLYFILSEEEQTDDSVLTHPSVQSAMDTFNARLIKEEQNG